MHVCIHTEFILWHNKWPTRSEVFGNPDQVREIVTRENTLSTCTCLPLPFICWYYMRYCFERCLINELEILTKVPKAWLGNYYWNQTIVLHSLPQCQRSDVLKWMRNTKPYLKTKSQGMFAQLNSRAFSCSINSDGQWTYNHIIQKKRVYNSTAGWLKITSSFLFSFLHLYQLILKKKK